MVVSKQVSLISEGRLSFHNVTDQVTDFVGSSGIRNGQVTVFYQHTTGSIIIGEHEAGIMADAHDMFERIAPTDFPYKHHIRGVDFNGHAHLRAALMPTSVTIPVVDGLLSLGTYQEILVIDDQVEQEIRYLVFQIIGE